MKNHDEIIELLRTFVLRNDPDSVEDAQQSLQPFGDEAVTGLAETLKDSDIDLCIFVLQVLGHYDGDTESALPAMIRALEDPHRIVRIAAIGPVAELGEKAKLAVPILMKWLDSEDEFSRVSAVGHVLQIDPTKADKLLPILVESLESDDCVIQCQSAWLLGKLGELARCAVPALKRLLDDESSSVRRVVGDALQEITGRTLGCRNLQFP
jgi:HEAT repeat protein